MTAEGVYTRKPRTRNVDHTIVRPVFSSSNIAIRDTESIVRSNIDACVATENLVFHIVSDFTVQIYAPKNTFALCQPKANEPVGKDNQTFRHGDNPRNMRRGLKMYIVRIVRVAYSMECLHQANSEEGYCYLVMKLGQYYRLDRGMPERRCSVS